MKRMKFFANFLIIAALGINISSCNNPVDNANLTVKADETINLIIDANINGWTLADKIPDQDKCYIIFITVEDNILVGAGSNGFALDLLTDVIYPLNHTINLTVGNGAIISGRGGTGGNITARIANLKLTGDFSKPGTGTTAINVGSNISITGSGKIQGGGGGGGAVVYYSGTTILYNYGGGGGAGIPGGAGGVASNANTSNFSGGSGNATAGGNGGSNSNGYGGKGGNPGQAGTVAKGSPDVASSVPGQGGNAIKILSPAIVVYDDAITLIGGIETIN